MAGSAGNSNHSAETAQSTSYADRDCRISKENLYMVLALHMQEFPGEPEIGDYKKVGAVLVLPNDMLYAVDCSRDGVHGVARLLMAHPETAQECKVFVSRKPCSFCTKLLVQSKVKRVFYLPIEPEYYKEASEGDFGVETSRVDELFKVSSIAQSVFVPRAGQDVIDAAERKHQTDRSKRTTEQNNLFNKYWNVAWFEKREAQREETEDAQYICQKKLPWRTFEGKMKKQVKEDFKSIAEWMDLVLSNLKLPRDPLSEALQLNQYIHLMKLAFFLAERTDDPKRGVGAVIVNKDKDIVGLGWNGFPTKSLYGEFPRASRTDEAVTEKKYPYIIHAEQNALLMRNTKSIKDATLVVTMTPCDDCTPLIKMQGIKTVVLGEKIRFDSSDPLIKFTKFRPWVDDIDDGIKCIELTETKEQQSQESGEREETERKQLLRKQLTMSLAVKRKKQSQLLQKQLMMSLAVKRKKKSQLLNSPPPKLKHNFKNRKEKLMMSLAVKRKKKSQLVNSPPPKLKHN